MAQSIGIMGFLLALLALFFASEVMRRASHRQVELEAALFKAMARIQQIEAKMTQVDRLAAEVLYEKKRQAETIRAMANKGELKTAAHDKATTERFTPSEYKEKNTA